jgi:dynactin complex subunit
MESNKHGGFRNNAGRKPLPENAKKKTSVIRIDAELLPLVEKLKQGLPVTQNQVWQQTTALTEDDLKEQANCIERLMSENTLLKATNAQLDKELQRIKIDSSNHAPSNDAEIERLKETNKRLRAADKELEKRNDALYDANEKYKKQFEFLNRYIKEQYKEDLSQILDSWFTE